jgi:hypothetical protein
VGIFVITQSSRVLAKIDILVSCVLPPTSAVPIGRQTPQLVPAETYLSVLADTVPLMGNAGSWAGTAGNKFREAARSAENPTTKLLAEGLTALAEALRELDDNLVKLEQQVRSGT